MKKVFGLSWLLMLSASTLSYAFAEEISATKTYELDETAINKEILQESNIKDVPPIPDQIEKPKIITEEIPNGRIEKLLDNENHIIAEKKIEGDKITQKVLYYYYPTGELMRKVTATENNDGFQAQEYYQNGKIGSEATYLNEDNKIGIEKKYDIQGILRQEIPWSMPKEDEGQGEKDLKTIRYGEIITYYPDGHKAATFTVGKKGKNIFYNRQGEIIKEINDSQILKFTDELTDEDCQGKVIHLNLSSLIELYEDEGDISYNKCGMPYRENFVYEVFANTPDTDQLISYDETGMIRRITPYVNGVKHGVMQKYDASGNLTAEINYQDGEKQGDAKGYFPTREVAFQKHYENGKTEGKMTCFYPTGEVAAEFNYEHGLKEGTATINSPIKKQLRFSQGKLLETSDDKEENPQKVSVLAQLGKVSGPCLQISDKLTEIEQSINKNINDIEQIFTIQMPQQCEDINTFTVEDNKLVCKDSQNQTRAEVPSDYNQGLSVIEKIYTQGGQVQYEIPIINKKKQGWTKAYNNEGNLSSDIYFNQDSRTGTSRSYYPNGIVKDMLVYDENTPRKVMVNYNQNGQVLFSLTSKEDDKQEAYLTNQTTGKNVTIKYENNAIDIIRENTLQIPYDYTEYNLSQGEYAIYRNNELVGGGSICNAAQNEDLQKTTSGQQNDGQVKNEKQDISSEAIEIPPILSPEDAPLISESDIEEMIGSTTQASVESNTENKVENAIIPSEKEKQQAELAARNIGPTAKPDIEDMSAVVQREEHNTDIKRAEENLEPKTEKFYYPNGNLRKTVKTKGSRTEEIKEYSKNGLLLTDTQYNRDKIIIEKYFGSGEIRRKTEKSYDDNVVNSFLKREDFYDNGNPRYTIERKPQTMLFSEKTYDAEGKLKTETIQTGPLTFKTKEYGEDGHQIREIDYPENKAILVGKDNQTIRTYNAAGKVQLEVTWYNNGEISVKEYNKDSSLAKFAYLAASDGKLHIEKPELRIIPAYRERYWVDYNNPHWIENQDKYSVKSIARLNLDIVSRILTELQIAEPQQIKTLKTIYKTEQ